MKLEIAKNVLAFLESIEGAGCGGMADYEIARQQMRVCVADQEETIRTALRVFCFTRIAVKNGGEEHAGNATTISARLLLAELERAGLKVVQS